MSAEVLNIDANVHIADIQKRLVDAALLNARCQFLKVRHNPVRHRRIYVE